MADLSKGQIWKPTTGSREPVTRESLERFSEVFADLADPQVMDQAWR